MCNFIKYSYVERIGMNHLDPMEAAVNLASLVLDIHTEVREYDEDMLMEMVRYAESILGIE